MELLGWQAPGGSNELAVWCGPQGARDVVLVLPAWFDEANKTRHFTIATMRLLEARGVASVLPDLPGCNESLAAMADQTLASWRQAAHKAATQFGCTHVLAIRTAAAIAPDLPGWAYAPQAGKSALRTLLRAESLAAKEAGKPASVDDLLMRGQQQGLLVAGWQLGAQMVRDLAALEPANGDLAVIEQSKLAGPGLWLRAEPDHDPAQAQALAAIILADLAS